MTRRAKMGSRTKLAAKLRHAGKTYGQIANEMGVGSSAVWKFLKMAKRHASGEALPVGRPSRKRVVTKWDAEVPKCRCGLRLFPGDVHQCVAGIDEFAAARPGNG